MVAKAFPENLRQPLWGGGGVRMFSIPLQSHSKACCLGQLKGKSKKDTDIEARSMTKGRVDENPSKASAESDGREEDVRIIGKNRDPSGCMKIR